jgi:hypothetical protein
MGVLTLDSEWRKLERGVRHTVARMSNPIAATPPPSASRTHGL